MSVAIDYAIERERLMSIAMDPERRDLDHLHPAAVVWDLDSTVADTSHRHHMLEKIKAGDATWDDYSLACLRDTPVTAAVATMKLFWRSSLQIAVSGRGAIAQAHTEKWVRVWKVPLDKVILRPEGDFTPSDELKVRELRAIEDAGITILLYVDDWPSTANAVADALRIPVLKVNPDYACFSCGSSVRACPCGKASLGGSGS